MSSRSLRDGGVTFVPLDDEDVRVVLVTRRNCSNPALAPLRVVLHDAADAGALPG